MNPQLKPMYGTITLEDNRCKAHRLPKDSCPHCQIQKLQTETADLEQQVTYLTTKLKNEVLF